MEKKHRIAIIDKDKCKPKKCAKECMKSCPPNLSGKICIEIEETAKINDQLCIGCNACVKKCPFDAIKIVQLPSQIVSELIHSYGDNMFKLYGMPTAKMGKIVGIVGPNGCGKTTILNILTKKILPNFGNNHIVDCNKSLTYVRGNEMHKYLSLLYDGKLDYCVKPQNILSIVKSIKNKDVTVNEILDKFKNSDRFDNIVSILDMKKIFDNKVINLSGGELQKLACIITLLRDSKVYVFDEPANYLDIECRIKIANLIKDLIRENDQDKKYVFVVEHDLSILDFIADYVHLVYGKAASYGKISSLHTTAEGINMFFDGYDRTDNIKFRDMPHKLVEQAIAKEPDDLPEKTNYYKNITIDKHEINFDNFLLTIPEINISHDTNIITILGKNGTGKTTYLSWLNNTLPEIGLSVSYKQQLNSDIYQNTTVQDILYNKCREAMTEPMFISDIINLLNLNDLFDKKIKKLSGGEFQRLSLALCLGQKADVYLLDESSASLDVDQRFAATKAIKRFLLKNKKLGFVIEHDILMAMSLAKELNSKIVVFSEISNDNGNRVCQSSDLLDFATGINSFLESIGVTFRSDIVNNRPKINKLNSIKDIEQKKSRSYYL